MNKENARLSVRKRIHSDRYPLTELQEGLNEAKQAEFVPPKRLLTRNQSNNEGALQQRSRINSSPSLSALSNTASRNRSTAQSLQQRTLTRSISTSRPVVPLKPTSSTSIKSNGTSRSKSPAVPSTTFAKQRSLAIPSNGTSRNKSPLTVLSRPPITSRNTQQSSAPIIKSNSSSRNKNPASTLLAGTSLKNKSTLQQYKTSLITTNGTLRSKNLEIDLRLPPQSQIPTKITLKQPATRLRSKSTSEPLKASHINSLMRNRISGGKCVLPDKIESVTSLIETQVISGAPPLISPSESPQKIIQNKIRTRSASSAKRLEFGATREERIIDESTYTITTQKVSVETCKTSISSLFGTNLLSVLPNFAKTASNLRSPSVESEEIAKAETYEENKLFGLQAINDDIEIASKDAALPAETKIEEDVSKQEGRFEFNVISRFMSWFYKSKPVEDYELPPLDLEDVNERELFLNTSTDEYIDPAEYFVLVTKCLKNNEKSELKYFQYWRKMLDKQIEANKTVSSVEIVMKFLTKLNSGFNGSNAHLLRRKVLKLINGIETKQSSVYVTRAEIQIGSNSEQDKKEKVIANEKQPARKHTLHQKLEKRSQKNEYKNSLQIEHIARENYLWEYRSEIDKYLRSRQENLKCPEGALLDKTNFMARLDVLNWVVTMQKEFYLSSSMYFMVVRLFDNVLAFNKISLKQCKMVASSLIWIVTKCYGVHFLKLPELERLCNITGRELLDMEKCMLKYFNFKLTINEPGYFAADYLNRACISLYHQITYATFFIMETFTYTPRFSQYEPSAIASSAVYMAFELLLPNNDLEELKKIFSSSDLDVLNEVLIDMKMLLHKLSTVVYEPFQGTILKYSGENLKDAAAVVLKHFM